MIKVENEKRVGNQNILLILIFLCIIEGVDSFSLSVIFSFFISLVFIGLSILFCYILYKSDKIFLNLTDKYIKINNETIKFKDIEYIQKIKKYIFLTHFCIKLRNDKEIIFLFPLSENYSSQNFIEELSKNNIQIKKVSIVKKNIKKSDYKLHTLGDGDEFVLKITSLILFLIDILYVWGVYVACKNFEFEINFIFWIYFIVELLCFTFLILITGIGLLFYNIKICGYFIDFIKFRRFNTKIEYNFPNNIIIVNGIKHKISDLSHYDFESYSTDEFNYDEKILRIYKKDKTSFEYYCASYMNDTIKEFLLNLGITQTPKS